jgi:starch synthase (maltosyl-transferring)
MQGVSLTFPNHHCSPTLPSLARRLANSRNRPWPSEPVPIALVITELEIGGAERALVSLATGLDRGRWSPTVIALGPDAALARPLREAGIPVACLGLSPRRPLRAIRRLAAALRASRPCLIQSFLFHANVLARVVARRAGDPPVLAGIRVAEHGKAWHRALERWTFSLGAGAVCVSEGVRKFSVEMGRLPADSLVVIPNGVDVATFDRSPVIDRGSLAVPDGAHLALFVGRLDVQKGVADLVRAAGIVAAERPDWYLAIAGDGPERDSLHALAKEIPCLPGRIRWLGHRDDIPSLLKAADLLVLPSRWEGMPNVVLEAMAARRPVVATAVEGTAELVVPGQTGWLVRPGDSTALAGALLDAATDRARLRRFGEAARARVEAAFTCDGAVAAYEALWAGVLGLDLGAIHANRLDPPATPLQ